MSGKELLKKEIDILPELLIDEVLDFVRFLEMKSKKESFAKISQELSIKSFEKVWDNEEDAIYDNL